MKRNPIAILRNSIFSILGTFITYLSSISFYMMFGTVINETKTAFRDSVWLYIVHFLPAISATAFSILIYYYIDNLDLFNKRDYYCSKNRRTLISEPQYLVAFLIGLVFSAALFETPINYALSIFNFKSSLVSRGASVLIYSAIRLVQLYLLRSKWDLEFESPIFVQKAAFSRNRDFDNFKTRQLIFQPLGFFTLLFIVLAFFARWGAPIVLALIIIFKDLGWLITPIILILCLIPMIVSAIYGLRARRKLISRLKKIEKLGYAKITYEGNKYLSALFPKRVFSFTLEDRNGKKYNCIVISCGKMNSPIYFKENEFLIERSVRLNNGALISRGGAYAQIVNINELGGDQNPTNSLAGYFLVLPIDFPIHEGKKTVIVNPIPSKIFVMDNVKAKPIDTGEQIFNYTVYNTTGFCNMIERDND